jgi:hypothetical protein
MGCIFADQLFYDYFVLKANDPEVEKNINVTAFFFMTAFFFELLLFPFLLFLFLLVNRGI